MKPAIASFFFFFNDPATTEIYTLSLHDALPISVEPHARPGVAPVAARALLPAREAHADRADEPVVVQVQDDARDRKSTRLNSIHANISYAVFCLKKKELQSNQYDVCLPPLRTTT